MTPRIAFAALVAAILGVGTIDYRTSEATAHLYDGPAPRERDITPAEYERCAKHRTDYTTLRRETASRSDGGHWVIQCDYED